MLLESFVIKKPGNKNLQRNEPNNFLVQWRIDFSNHEIQRFPFFSLGFVNFLIKQAEGKCII